MSGIHNPVRINKPSRLRVIIAGLKEVETEVRIVEIAAVAERVQSADGGGG